MSRAIRGVFFGILLSGCSLTNPSLIFDDEDAGVMDAAVADGGRRDAASSECDPSDHRGCDADELCCDRGAGPTCVSTSANECEACETACDAEHANACANRTCQCGTDAACGAALVCDASIGDCIECFDISDCDGEQCLEGECQDCNPIDNAGCSGVTPICNPTSMTCGACTTAPDNCPGILTCTGTGACGGCNLATHEGCENPTAPICADAGGENVCRGCTNDPECTAATEDPECLSDGRCARCDPADNEGCNGTTPICTGSGGFFGCRACEAGECGGGSVCAGTGECVSCGGIGEPCCAGNACGTGYCVTGGTCRACNPSNHAGCSGTSPICSPGFACGACASDGQCPAGTPQCVTSGAMAGACGVCDPADSATCTGNTPICSATTLTCSACSTSTDCSSRSLGSHCSHAGPRTGGCGACDPQGDLGCMSPTPACHDMLLSCAQCQSGGDCASLGTGYQCASANMCVCTMSTCNCGSSTCTPGQFCQRTSGTCIPSF